MSRGWDDERDDDAFDGPEAPPGDETVEHELPPPSTYAGRRRSEPAGEPEEPEHDLEAEAGEPEGDYDEEDLADGAPDEDEDEEEYDEEEYDEEEYDEEEYPSEELATEGNEDEELGGDEDPEPADEVLGDEEADAEAAGSDDAEPEPGSPDEADTNREQSTDAALAGLRARAAGKEGAGAGAAAPAAEVEQPTVAATSAGAAERAEEDGKTPRARPVWARFLAASLVIVASVAAATSISLLLFLTDIAAGLGGIPDIEDDLTNIDPGGPQTILILGSDKRPTDDSGRSDTAILLRVDPDKKAIALLSIPRDLKVNIPNHGQDRFNAAYSYGGPELALKTVKSFTGLEINHVVNVNFTGFADAVNAIDCVYVDVDRRYFIPPESGIAEIDIQAGYQRLCGLKALQYVRYRHTDNDLVRAARQQDFIREARQNLPPSKLISDREELLDIFAEYTTSDNALKDPVAVFELIKTFYFVRNVPVHEVHFPAQLGTSYVSASDEAIQNAVEQFLGTAGTPGAPDAGEGDGGGDGGDQGGGDRGGEKKEKPSGESKPEGPPMTDASGAILPYAQKIAATKKKDGDPMVEFDVYHPTLVPPDTEVSSSILEASRAFPIDGPGNEVYHGYKFVLGMPGAAGFTEYWGVSGTDWTDPPILENPSETREIDGREYMLYYDGDRLRLVGWKSKNASYWVNNTLLQTLEEGEMLAIATNLRELGN